jgi:hypothetical protein
MGVISGDLVTTETRPDCRRLSCLAHEMAPIARRFSHLEVKAIHDMCMAIITAHGDI